VGPVEVAISPSAPARVQIAVPDELLGAGDALTLSVALLRPDNSIVTDATSYDVSNGILTAYVYELGPVAAVIATDGLVIGDIADVPPLDGGAIAPVSPLPADGPASAPPTRPDGVVFSAGCSPGERSCFTSGIAKLWVDDIVRQRLGSELVLLNTTVEASIEFFSFDLSSLPDSAVGYLRIDGDLRARINQVVASREVGDEVAFYTGNGSDANNPGATSISISGGQMTFAYTSQDDPEIIAFDVSGVGTSELLTIQVEGELEFENASGAPTLGAIVAQVRLRR